MKCDAQNGLQVDRQFAVYDLKLVDAEEPFADVVLFQVIDFGGLTDSLRALMASL